MQVAAAMLGRSNYNKLSEDSKSEFSPSTVILIDKEEHQIIGSKDRLESWETSDVGGRVGLVRHGWHVCGGCLSCEVSVFWL